MLHPSSTSLLCALLCACGEQHAANLRPSRTELQIFADYHQLYVQDERAQLDAASAGKLWSAANVERMFASAAGTVALGTLRNTTVPVAVEIRAAPPELVLDGYDHVVEGGLRTHSAQVVVYGCTEDRALAKRIAIPAGEYRVRMAVRGARTLTPDQLDGSDAYEVTIWPGKGEGVVVHKQLRR